MEHRQSYTLVGKLISGPDFVTGETITGIVSALFFDGDGKSFVRVNGRSVDVEQISLISDPALFQQEGVESIVGSEKSNPRTKEDLSFQEIGRSSIENRQQQGVGSPVDTQYPGAKNGKNGY